MVRKICLDSDIIIDLMNDAERAKKIIPKIQNTKIFTTSVNIFELLSRISNTKEIENYISYIDTLNFDEKDAVEAAKIRIDLKKKGKIAGVRDIFIASIAKRTDSELLTFNRKHFENIKGLKLVKF